MTLPGPHATGGCGRVSAVPPWHTLAQQPRRSRSGASRAARGGTAPLFGADTDLAACFIEATIIGREIKGYINGTSSALVNSNQSCLAWYGGNMPTSGSKSVPQAVTDMNAWAAAGAQNN